MAEISLSLDKFVPNVSEKKFRHTGKKYCNIVIRHISIKCRYIICPTMSQLASASSTSEDLKRWPRLDKRRLLHIVYRVVDLEKTMEYGLVSIATKLFPTFEKIMNQLDN
jgi:hypothetical protein